MKKGAVVGIGLGIACLGQLVSFALAGAGHGWLTPFWLSPLLFIAYPVVLFRAANGRSRRSEPAIEAMAVALALLSDVLLFLLTFREGLEYLRPELRIAPEIVAFWAVIWLGWQAVAVINFVNGRRRAAA